MKSIISIFMIICFVQFNHAQEEYYSKSWDDVQQLENKGLTKSALDKVKSISKRALEKGNVAQRIKALLFQSKYALILEEDAQLEIIKTFKSEIDNSDIITKRVLQNLLATLYWQYFQQNRHRFYNRTHLADKIDDDFRTWDLQMINEEIHSYFQKSLQNGLMLQQESLDNYKDIIIFPNKATSLRPTLYDLLCHNALSFYKTYEDLNNPSYAFEIDQLSYLSSGDTFMNLTIESKDSLSLKLNAIKIYQNLLKFHYTDSLSEPYVDVDIERLNFIYQHSSNDEKTEALFKTLQLQSEALRTKPISGLYAFEVAKNYQQQGNRYNRLSEDNEQYRWDLKTAVEICTNVISKFPDSRGAKQCNTLIQQVKTPFLKLTSEKFVPTNTYSKLLVNYKNLETISLKLYKINEAQLKKYSSLYNVNDQQQFINNLLASKVWDASLPDENDFQQHSTEIIIPQLQNAIYIIKAQTIDSDVFATTVIQATNLALIESNEDKKDSFQIIDRNNGKPKPGAIVEMHYQKNHNQSALSRSFTTDRYGKFYFKKDRSTYHNIYYKIKHKNEEGYFGQYYINRDYNYKSKNDTNYKSFVFTDRSIYRPGQTVYFKGILSKTTNEKTSVADEMRVHVALHNVNGEQLSEQEFTTNDFGSFKGEFILPNDGLTGQYYIRLQSKDLGYDNTYFSVEEYKRPKFEANFNPVTQLFKVNDTVTVNGEANAFAGSTITNAKVVYRVVRTVNYPVWYYWRRPYYNATTQEIAHGETKTDSTGQFFIDFRAIPDSKANKDDLPIFNYEITADITDINGETQTATTSVKVGYHAMTANIILNGNINKAQKSKEITIETRNLNGEYVSASGSLKIYKLIAPNKPLRPRPWLAPDYQQISEKAFNNMFPHEPYTNEEQLQNWKRGELVYDSKFNTNKSTIIALEKIRKWVSGKYIIELQSKDQFGQDVKAQTYTTVYTPNDKNVVDNELFSVITDKNSYNPNDTAIITFSSAAQITITLDIEKEGKIINTYLIGLDNSKSSIDLDISYSDLGGFVLHYSYAAYNYFQSSSRIISVPYPKTDLQIETTTFRDKLLPGQNETWSFKVKGPKGDKVTAEILASMYDASLDQFRTHNWFFNPIPDRTYDQNTYKNGSNSFGTIDFRLFNRFKRPSNYINVGYPQFNWFGFYFGRQNIMMMRSMEGQMDGLEVENDDQSLDEIVVTGYDAAPVADSEDKKAKAIEDEDPFTSTSEQGIKSQDAPDIQIRTNLQETAFFFPQLQTDAEGNVSFNFVAPEALTRWKLQLLAHTKDLESNIKQLEAVTQKELMVIPNAPRFLREGDNISISTKIANLTDNTLSGYAQLMLTDAVSGHSIDSLLNNANSSVSFIVDAKGNTQASWRIEIPENIQAVQYKIIAKADSYSDGEQNVLPVLTNRMLVTETLPLWVRANQNKTFVLDKLKDNTSTTLNNHKLTLEMTSNPAWYAIQALPYLMEYPYDCNEQTFSRYYSNALAQHIVLSNPKIKTVFNQWRTEGSLSSNLEKNQELKSILIQETPWLRDAQSESEQKKRIALLFDFNRMNNELQSSLRKLSLNQSPSGAWPWFNGGRDNRYITQHIISGFGHLKQLGVNSNQNTASVMVQKAIKYLDNEFVKEYNTIKKYNPKADLSKDHLSFMQLHYLYVRSFYPEIKTSAEIETIKDYYTDQISKYWISRSLYSKGLMALSLHRNNKMNTARAILKSLKENSITSEELGMYWKANTASWHWYQAPIETQALMIEAFAEIDNDVEIIDNLKVWLLKNKQTNSWKNTKATTDAVYALLLQGSDWLSINDAVEVKVGDFIVSPNALENVKVEAGTGYFKTSWTGNAIESKMATVSITKKTEGIAWGALYWQYFEDLDKITSAKTPLQLKKKLFLKTNTDKGEEISEITSSTQLKVGDLLRVRIELRSDRDMQFLHLKDMRASGLEPVNVLSRYKWQDGLGYYESTKDAATNFFIDYLPNGIYVFEYDLRVNNSGNMSNGITTIQSMYAPEFSSHSEGIRIEVK